MEPFKFNIWQNMLFSLLFCVLNINVLAQSKSNKNSFTKEELNLIYSADSSKEMRVLKITNREDSIFLRQKSKPIAVNPRDTALLHFIQRLYKTVIHPNSRGIGIAAPQVGLHRQIIWVQRLDKPNEPFEVYLNIRITKYSDSTKLNREGCLSIPKRYETVERPCSIVIEYDKIDGTHHQETISGGFTAVIFQHEVDHLNGILYLDHLQQEMKDQRLRDNFSEKKKKFKKNRKE